MRFSKFDKFLKEEFIHEGFAERARGYLKGARNFFKGAAAFVMNLLAAQKEKELPKGVTLYPTKQDIELAKKSGLQIVAPPIPEIPAKVKDEPDAEGFASPDEIYGGDSEKDTNEAVIQTKYPDIGKIRNVTFKQLMESIRITVESGADTKPLLIWGAPGIGKTAIVNAVAAEYFGPNPQQNRRMIDFDLMLMGPEDFSLPTVNHKDANNPRMSRVPDEFLPIRRIDDIAAEDALNGPDGKGGILFFDELARCNAKVQGVCLKIIDERRIGNYVLGKNWVIICAANRKSDLSDDEQQEFHWSSTLANRFRQVNYATEFQDWVPWASTAKDAHGSERVRPEILAFLRFNGKYFHLLDPELFSTSAGGSEAWPSPRSWTDASDVVNALRRKYEKNGWKDSDGNAISDRAWMDIMEETYADSVGAAAAKAFVGFQKLMKKISPEDIKMVWSDGTKAPKWKKAKGTGSTEDQKLAIDEIDAYISAVVFQVKGEENLTKPQMMSFTNWLCNSGDAPNCIKAISLLYAVVPSVQQSDYWQIDCKNKINDSFPTIFDQSRQKS